MPFTANRQFKKNPRMLAKAKACTTGRRKAARSSTAPPACGASMPATAARRSRRRSPSSSTRWITHRRSKMGHPKAFELAARHAALLPGDLNHAFLLQFRVRGRRLGAQDRAGLPPRARRRHAHAFRRPRSAAITASASAASPWAAWSTIANGLAPCCRASITCRTPIWRRTPSRRASPSTAWSSLTPLEGIVGLHDASNIAAVIVEPCAGSTGYLPPPKGYLQRLRQICDKHGILLIFDEVITGFGRLGTAFAADKFGVIPDLMTVAKGISNANGADGWRVRAQAGVRRPHERTGKRHRPVPRLHLLGPSAGLRGGVGGCSISIATRNLFERSAELSPYWEEGVHSLKGLPNVVDIRNLGLAAGIDLAPKGAVGTRGYEAFSKASSSF